MKRTLGLFILLLSVVVKAEIFDAQIVYYPFDDEDCKPVSDRMIYPSGKWRYKFKLMIRDNEKFRKYVDENSKKDIRIKIYSVVGKEILTPDDKPYKDYSLKTFLRRGDHEGDAYVKTIKIRPPKRVRSHKWSIDNPLFVNWNVFVVMTNRDNKDMINVTSYQLKVLGKGAHLYQKIEGAQTLFSSGKAQPNSEVFDNYDGSEPLDVAFYDEEYAWRFDNKNYSKGIRFGGSIDSNMNIRMWNSWQNTLDAIRFFGQWGLQPMRVAFAVGRDWQKNKVHSRDHRRYMTHYFTLAPGETGMIFTQPHMVESSYRRFGADECGMLSFEGTEVKKEVYLNHSMVPMDRSRVGDMDYYDELAGDYLPEYNFQITN